MRVIALSTLQHFYQSPEYKDAMQPVTSWYRFALRAAWLNPAHLKAADASASILKDGRAVFNLGGNKYRLVTWINYSHGVIYVRFIGTHAQYDKIDAQRI